MTNVQRHGNASRTGRSRATSRLRAAGGIALTIASLLALTGCLLAEPTHAEMTIVNESTTDVEIFVFDSTRPEMTVRAGETLHKATSGGEGDCIDWVLQARNTEGLVVATFGPPVCDADRWTITQDEVDTAQHTQPPNGTDE